MNNLPTSVNSTAKNLLYSYIDVGDDYVIATTADYEYTMYRRGHFDDVWDVYVCRRVTTTGNTHYELTINEDAFDGTIADVTYPYYAYSNIEGCGIRETLPIASTVTALSTSFISVTLALALMFSVIFRRSKRA